MKHHYRIRAANARDLRAILHLINSQAHSGKILKRSLADIRKVLRCFIVAEVEGRVIACCALEVYNKKLAEVRSLAVEPASREKGVASALVQHCIQCAKNKKIYEVLVITDRHRIFSRLGFSQQLHGQKALFLRP